MVMTFELLHSAADVDIPRVSGRDRLTPTRVAYPVHKRLK